jgi:hypothetical protein
MVSALPCHTKRHGDYWRRVPLGDSSGQLTDREGAVIRERFGAWLAEAWWPPGARGGPHELRIRPADSTTDPAEVARGISTVTVSQVPLVKMTEDYAKLAPAIDEAAEEFREAQLPRGRSQTFFAQVAQEYARLTTAGERKPVAVIAAHTGKSTDAVRQWVRRARHDGYLTEGESGKTGGQLTDAARAVLSARREAGAP